jgi:RecA/RadA recombinase
VSDKLATGIEALDERLGGLPRSCLVQVHGPAGAGKSSLALTLARHVTPCCLVLAERLHRRRVASVVEPVAEQVLVARPGSLDEQEEALAKASELLGQGKVEAVVLDSLTFLYRFVQGSSTDALGRLFDQLGWLHDAAREGEGLALFTNQVRGGHEGPQPIGGPGVRHVSDVILSLEESEGAWRRLEVAKHPFEPAGARFDVKITRDGVR